MILVLFLLTMPQEALLSSTSRKRTRSKAGLDVKSGDSGQWRLRAEELQRAGRRGEAERFYRKAVSREPSDAAALNNLGVLARERGGSLEAEVYYSRAVSADPTLGPACANLGQALLERGATIEALHPLRLGIGNGHPALHKHLGLALTAAARSGSDHAFIVEADHSLRHALQLEPLDSGGTIRASLKSLQQLQGAKGISTTMVHGSVSPSVAKSNMEFDKQEKLSLPRRRHSATTDALLSAVEGGELEPTEKNEKIGVVHHNQKLEPIDSDLHALTVATRTDEPGFEMLLHSAQAAGVPIWIRGSDSNTLRAWGTAAGGWGIKLRAMADVASRAKSSNSLILWVDAYDVLFSPAATPSRIRERFDTLGYPVVFAAEGYCEPSQGNCVGPGGDTNGESHPLQPYLNSGVMLARAGVLRDLLERYPFTDPVDDQHYFGTMWLKEKGTVLVDTARRLFACPFRNVQSNGTTYALSSNTMHQRKPPREELHLRAGGRIDAITATGAVASEPLFLHFNGPARALMEASYKALFPRSFRALFPNAAKPILKEDQGDDNPMDSKLVAAGELVGTPLRKGPWHCSPHLVWDENQAALCNDGEVIVDQIYVANLDRRTDRMNLLISELRRHGLRAIRFPSVDGNEIPNTEYERQDRSALRGIPRGHLGCFFTHLALWREIAQRRWQTAWILEDDATVVEDGVQQLADNIRHLRRIDQDWHFAYTGRNPVEVSRALLMNEGLLSHWPVRKDAQISKTIVDPGTSEGLWGYLLSGVGAALLVPVFTNMVESGITYDVDLSLHLHRPREKLRMYAIEPPIIKQREADSFSDTSGIARGRKQLLLGHQYMQGGKPAEAEIRFREALRSMQNGGADAALWVQETQRYLAAARARQSLAVADRAALEAEGLFRSALHIAAINESPAAKAHAGTLSDLCHFLSTQLRFEEAHSLCRKSLDVARKTGRVEDSCAAHGYIGILYDMTGQPTDAENAFRRAVSVGESSNVGQSRRCTDFANLCVFLKGQGRISEADDACARCPGAIDVAATHQS